MRKLAALPLATQPGEVFEYGLSTDMPGYLVEVISGQSLAELMQERIFDPLGTTDISFFIPANKQSRLATAYAPNESGGLDRVPDERTTWRPFVCSAAVFLHP